VICSRVITDSGVCAVAKKRRIWLIFVARHQVNLKIYVNLYKSNVVKLTSRDTIIGSLTESLRIGAEQLTYQPVEAEFLLKCGSLNQSNMFADP
jgi:hypothetical protein